MTKPSGPAELLAEVTRRLEALPAERLASLAARYGETLSADGLHVLKPEGRVPIAPLLTPVVPDLDAAPTAGALLRGVVQIARALFERRIETPPRLFHGLTPFEDATIRDGWRDAERVTSGRVDFLHDAEGRLAALEVNTTIPAMQGYSDIVARGWVLHIAPALGAKAEVVARAAVKLHSNVDDLGMTLLAASAENGRKAPKRWALLARENDSQDGELGYIARRFADIGLEPIRVTPGNYFEKAPFDLVYRHLFARRLEPGSPLEAVFRASRVHNLWNPVNGHLEIKGMLALLSTAAADPAFAARAAVDSDALDAAARRVPWTRLLLPGATIGPDGSAVSDLVAFAEAHPAELILKRSWDYGGRSVFMEEDFAGASGRSPRHAARSAREGTAGARLQEATGRTLSSWSELVRFAATDPSGDWIVQRRVRPVRRRHLRVVAGKPVWEDLVTDVSAFCGHGGGFAPSGLTARASGSLVVNIVMGGGMAPIIPADVLASVLA